MLLAMDYESVFNFLLKGRYPVGFLKIFHEKRVEITRLRVVFFIMLKDPSGDRQWKRVIKSKEEQERIMKACHASPEGKSLYAWLNAITMYIET